MIFTNKEIVQIAMRQSAIELNCNVEDFCKKENVVVASVLTSRLALEILNEGKVPFYCATWSNLKSVRNE